jgi:hypothetical protein
MAHEKKSPGTTDEQTREEVARKGHKIKEY